MGLQDKLILTTIPVLHWSYSSLIQGGMRCVLKVSVYANEPATIFALEDGGFEVTVLESRRNAKRVWPVLQGQRKHPIHLNAGEGATLDIDLFKLFGEFGSGSYDVTVKELNNNGAPLRCMTIF